MQLNLYLAKPDEAELLAFIRARGGYLAHDYGLEGKTLVEDALTFEAIPETRLFVIAEEAFPAEQLAESKWRVTADYGPLGQRSQFAGPRIDYQPDGFSADHIQIEGIAKVRFWAGFSAVSFYGPPPFKGGPPAGYPHGHENKAKLMMGLYNAIGRYVRKNWLPDFPGPGAVWCGPQAVPALKAGGWLKGE
jgi:hypothetical protein